MPLSSVTRSRVPWPWLRIVLPADQELMRKGPDVSLKAVGLSGLLFLLDSVLCYQEHLKCRLGAFAACDGLLNSIYILYWAPL